jgi:putative peptidoglycan lipid II flippase
LLVQVAAGNVLMVAFLLALAGDTQRWIDMRAWQRIEWMTLLVVGGAGIYFGTMFVLGLRVQDLKVRPVAVPPKPDDATPVG